MSFVGKILQFKGVPRKIIEGGKEKFNSFKKIFIPFINNKKVQGEEYLQAEVEKNKAEAFKIKSEGLLNMANARKIDAEADQIRQQTEERRQAQAIAMGAVIREEKLLPEYEDASFKKAMKGLVERINMLKAKYGTEMEVSESSDNQILIDSPGLDTK